MFSITYLFTKIVKQEYPERGRQMALLQADPADVIQFQAYQH